MSAQRTSTTRRLSRPATAALVLALALPAALVATGGELYQWKDANGVTHYSDAPPPGPDEGRALLYDLGDVLETVGETARALAVFLELDADAPEYRDVRDRVARLAQIETEG